VDVTLLFFTAVYVHCVVYTLFILLTTVGTLTNTKVNAQRGIHQLPSPIVDICLQFSDNCITCISADSCGFCLDTGLCLTGDINGPGGNPNNCSEWFFLECPISICAAFKSCRPWVSDSLCGWCFDTEKCEPGSVSGPVTGVCRHFAFGNKNLCNSPSPSRSRSRKPVIRTTSKPNRTTAKPNRTTAKPIRTTQKRNRTTGKKNRTTARRSNSPSHTPSNLLETSAAFVHQPIYLIFYILIALSSIAVVVTNF